MALLTHRRIENRGPAIQEEYRAGAAGIYPGMLLQLNSSGEVIVHAVVEGATPLIIALEDALQGNIVSTVYTDDNQVQCLMPSKGSVVNVLVASGQTVAIGTQLTSAGNGTFISSADATSGIDTVAVLLECIEGQATALSANTLVAARVL